MKTMKRIMAALLAVLLLTGLFPVLASAQAPELTRASVMIGADGLAQSDTLVLGYAKPDAAITAYPLEWQVLDAEKDSQGREGGKLLLCKYLLPAAVDTEDSGELLLSVPGLELPESFAFLPTTLSDKAYVANLNENYQNLGVDCAGVYTQRKDDALTAAGFFALSAEEVEKYLAATEDSLSFSQENDLLRRPYAAAYAVTDAGSRSWSLRSVSKTGNGTAVVPASNESRFLAESGGLIAAEDAEFSRPAFNLRSNAITFVYQTAITHNPIAQAGTVAPIETRPQIVDAAVTRTANVVGAGEWRAALHALPTLQLETRYTNNGSFVLTPPAGFGYQLGVLETDADGTVVYWGVARQDDFGVFSFTPDEGVTDLYFYSFEYDTVSGQLYTSNLVHAGAGAATGMTLGADHLRNGDTVSFGDLNMSVVDADKASTALGAFGSNITATASNNEYPLWDNEAVFMATKLPDVSVTYKHSSYDLGDKISEFMEFYNLYHRYDMDLCNEKYEYLCNDAAAAAKTANESNQKVLPKTDLNTPTLPVVDQRFDDSLAYTWTNDGAESVWAQGVGYSTSLAKNRAVNGTRFFRLSAKEYLSMAEDARETFNNVFLRSSVRDTHHVIFHPDIETVSDPVISDDDGVVTVNWAADVNKVGDALGFNLRRDHIVFMYQKDSFSQSYDTVSASELPEMPAYDADNGEWELALLDPSLGLTAVNSSVSACENPTISVTGAKVPMPTGDAASYISVFITDSAGNVKNYGRVTRVTYDLSPDTTFPIDIDYASLDYGDRVYVINETRRAVGLHKATTYCSEPLLIYEQKLAGEVNFSQDDYFPGETVVTDLSKITVSGCETLDAGWYAYRGVETVIGEDFLWTADGTDETVTFCTKCGLYGVKANLNAAEGVLMAYSGAHEQDDFTGDTLYYGENGTDNYTWTVVGRQTGGVEAVREKSGTEVLAKDLTTDNALALMRKDLTALGDLKVDGYMTYGVLESDLSDAAVTVNAKSFKAGSEENALTFRPSVMDHQKLADRELTTALFASTSDTEESWYLRNAGTASRYGMVDTIQQLQLKKSEPNPTRESVNLNNKDIVFITPADRDLTYSDLSGYREGSVDEWKLTVIDPDCIDYTVLAAYCLGYTVTAEYEFDEALANRYVTAWAEKDGEITWIDSEPVFAAGKNSVNFEIPEGTDFDEAFVVLRRDNGDYHTDVCTLPQSTEPVDVNVEIYLNGEPTDTGCMYYMNGSLESINGFYLGETVTVGVDAYEGYKVDDISVAFEDGTTEAIKDRTGLPGDEATFDFVLRSRTSVVRIDLITEEFNIYTDTVTYDENGDAVEELENKIIAPATARGGNTYTFTVECKEGYYIDTIRVDDTYLANTNPVDVLEVDGETVIPRKAYSPGEYTAKMPLAEDSYILVVYKKVPAFSLTLVAIPPEGGTITASDTENIKPETNVTVNAEPNEGWVLTKVTMYSDLYPEVELERGENGYTFEMPPAAATVEAWFEKICPISVEVYVNGKPSDYGCSWQITDDKGVERSTFYFGEEVNFTATADEGYTIELAQLVNSSMPYLDWNEDSASGSFPFPGEDAVIQIFLRTQMTNITIDCQTLDVDGTVMEKTAGGEVDAPADAVNYGELYFYAALANEGYYVESITANGKPVENPDPQEITVGGKTVTVYPSGDYEAHGILENVTYFVTFRKMAEHTITSEFKDISTETPVQVEDASVIYTVNGEEREVFYAGDQVTAIVTCADNYAIDGTETTPETAMTQPGTRSFTFTMPDSNLDVTYLLKKLAIRSAFLHVNEDINLIYSVQVPEDFTNPTATFTFLGKSYEVSDYTVGADGRYNFEFENVTPQCMGEPVDVTVSARCGKYTYSHTNTGYSVRQYCVNMLGKTDDELLKTLLSDILVYGEKAQLYTKFKTDSLVTEGVGLSVSTYPGLSGLHEDFIGTADEDVYWSAAALSLSNNVTLMLRFRASDTTGLSVTFKIGDRTQTFTEFTPVEGEDDLYTVSFRGIYATEFGYPVYASFYRDGAQIGNTLRYSVNIYICNKQDDGDPVFADLVRALYNYGASSLKYYQERMLDK